MIGNKQKSFILVIFGLPGAAKMRKFKQWSSALDFQDKWLKNHTEPSSFIEVYQVMHFGRKSRRRVRGKHGDK